MRLLLDTCVWGGALRELREAGFDAIWSGDWDKDPGDSEILAQAHRESRVLITLDKDFGELAIIRGLPHSGTLRLVDVRARRQGEYCKMILARYGAKLTEGAIVTAGLDRVRIRENS